MSEETQDILDLKAVEKQMMESHEALEGFIEKSNAEMEEAKTVSAETKSAIDKLAETSIEHGDLLADMQQKMVDTRGRATGTEKHRRDGHGKR